MGRDCICDVLEKRGKFLFLPGPKTMVKVALAGERSVPRISGYGISEVETGVIQFFQTYVGDCICPRYSSTGKKVEKH